MLQYSLVATVTLGLFAASVLFFAPGLVIKVLFGSKYLGAVSAVRILGLQAAVLGGVTLLVYFHLAMESLRCLYGWIGAVLAYAGIYL